MIPAFNSQILLAPGDGVGVMAFTNGSRNAATWLTGETEAAARTDRHPPARIRSDVPQHPETWRDLCGWYRPRAQPTDMQARIMLGAGAEVRVRRGQLMLRTLGAIPGLYRGLRLHPDDEDDPYVFWIDLSWYGLGTARIVFSRNGEGDDRRSLRCRRPAVRRKVLLEPAIHRPAGMSITTATELWRSGATDLAEAIRSRQASCEEVVEAHLRRIEVVNGAINAVVVILHEQALAAARAADRAVTAGVDLPPLHGVPFTVKGNIDLAGADNARAVGTGWRIGAHGCPGRRAPQGRRSDPDRPHQPAQLRGALALRQRAVGSDREPVGPVRDPGASSGGEAAARHRHEPAGARQRRARIAALARAVLRGQRPEAHARTHPGRNHRRAGTFRSASS